MSKSVVAHPLASLVPPMMQDELVELERDIQDHGQRQPIILYDGQILDGRHRYAVCQKLGIEPKVEAFAGSEAEAKALVLSLNVHRRHLTFAQKKALIEVELQRDPTQSDRMIAEKVKASPTSVGKVRAEAEAAGQLSTVDSSIGRDGKTRQRMPKAAPMETSFDPARVAESFAAARPALEAEIARDNRRAIREASQKPTTTPAKAEPLCCAFCSKTQHEVQKLIVGPYGRLMTGQLVCICDQCVDLCKEIVNEHRAKAAKLAETAEPEALIEGDAAPNTPTTTRKHTRQPRQNGAGEAQATATGAAGYKAGAGAQP